MTEVVKGLDSAKLIINIQGDEPLLEPKVIDGLIKIFDDSTVSMGTVVSRKIGIRDYLDRNVVKAFLDENQNAYDFKRDIYDSDIGGVFRHIGFYGFDRDTLLQFSLLPASKNEIKYSLEQFRALDNGIKIKAFISNAQQQAIDTPEDLDRVLSQLNKIKDTKMLLQIHDELVFECLKAKKDEVMKIVKKTMESVSSSDHHMFTIPLDVDINSGYNWDEAH